MVKAGVGSVMSSFNLIDYIPAAANKWMMTDVLKAMGIQRFRGYRLRYRRDSAARNGKDIQEASEQALKAGTDMDVCSNAFVKHLTKSIAEGKGERGGM